MSVGRLRCPFPSHSRHRWYRLPIVQGTGTSYPCPRWGRQSGPLRERDPARRYVTATTVAATTSRLTLTAGCQRTRPPLIVNAPLGTAITPKPPPPPVSPPTLWPPPAPTPPRTSAAGTTVTPSSTYGSPKTRRTVMASRAAAMISFVSIDAVSYAGQSTAPATPTEVIHAQRPFLPSASDRDKAGQGADLVRLSAHSGLRSRSTWSSPWSLWRSAVLRPLRFCACM